MKIGKTSNEHVPFFSCSLCCLFSDPFLDVPNYNGYSMQPRRGVIGLTSRCCHRVFNSAMRLECKLIRMLNELIVQLGIRKYISTYMYIYVSAPWVLIEIDSLDSNTFHDIFDSKLYSVTHFCEQLFLKAERTSMTFIYLVNNSLSY